MPFLRSSRRLARGERITRADLFDVPTEVVIAQFRIVLCAISLFTVFFEPMPPRYAAGAQAAVAAYSVFAFVSFGIALMRIPGPMARCLIHGCDLFFLAVIFGFVTGGRPNPMVAVSAFFILIAAALRWNWRGVFATAIAFAAVMLGVNALHLAASNSSDRDWSNAASRTVYLLFAGGMLAYFSGLRERRRVQLARLADWPGPDPTQAHSPSLAVILAHCARVLEVPRVLVLWEEPEEPVVNVAVWDNKSYEHARRPAGAFGDFVRPQHLLHSAFLTNDVESGRVLLHTGPARLKTPIFHEDLIRTFQICSVATAPVPGTFCNGRVFILDRGSWSEFQLLLTELIASRIGLELDRHILQLRNEEATATRERARLTRDLHDGILQSLTAVAIQLKLLGEGKDLDTQIRLDTSKQLLNNVQIQIRNFVRRTWPSYESGTGVMLVKDMQRVLSETSRLWDCTTSLSVEPQDASVSAAMGGQLALMLAEAVSNAVRHGGASAVDVIIRRANGQLLVNVRDNGRGFDGSPFKREHDDLVASGAGPISLRERASELGGSLDVSSSAAGTELQIRVPLP
jgi:signal transduction histidine kinase